jgi:hypothetical protein
LLLAALKLDRDVASESEAIVWTPEMAFTTADFRYHAVPTFCTPRRLVQQFRAQLEV